MAYMLFYMKKQLFFTIFILLISLFPVVANLDKLNLGLNYSNSGEYMKSIELLENNCPDSKEDISCCSMSFCVGLFVYDGI